MRKMGRDLSQYDAWQQLQIFQSRLNIEDDKKLEEVNDEILPSLVRISVCDFGKQGLYWPCH